MKQKIKAYQIIIMFLLGALLYFPINAQTELTFQVDMTQYDLKEGTSIGLRGSLEPLSWTSSVELKDPENDGIYSITIQFDGFKYGERLNYKYMAGEIWERDLFGEAGNRVISLCTCSQVLPIDIWDTAEFSLEILLLEANHKEFNLWLYLIAGGKKKGKTVDDVVQEYIDHWGAGFDWVQSPNDILTMEEFDQKRYADGLFEVMENTPGHVKFKMRNAFGNFIKKYSKDGTAAGVTIDEIIRVREIWFKKMAEAKGWEFEWVLDGVDVTIELYQK